MTANETKLTGEVSKVDRSVDRLKTCPFLLRVFWDNNRHYSSRDYEKEQLPQNELQIHTWMDATLGELTQLIKDVIPDVRTRGIQFAFAIVSPDGSYNRYHISEIGKTENGQQRPDNQIQLGSKRFHVGDYIDVAIIRRRPDAPHSSSLANNRRDRGGPGHSSEDSNRRRHGGGGGGGANDRNERNDRNGSGNGPTRSGPSGW